MPDRTPPAGDTAPGAPQGGLVLIYTTLPDPDAADIFAVAMLEAGLIACANILGPVTAHYRWNDKLERASEVAVLLKTTREGLDAALLEAGRHHPYEVPALIVIEPAAVNPAYLDWSCAQLARDAAGPEAPLDTGGKGD